MEDPADLGRNLPAGFGNDERTVTDLRPQPSAPQPAGGHHDAEHYDADASVASGVPSLCDEEIVDAVVAGDRTYKRGTAAAALRYPAFRRVYAGWLASNVGSWMQNVVLTAWAYELTKSASFVGLVLFAQLGPLLLFSLVGGALADRFDRKRLIIMACGEQALAAFGLAWIATSPDPSKPGILFFVFAIGMGQALIGPTFSSVLPTLVDKPDLPGAVSLVSVNMNGSRVIGAVIGPWLYFRYGVPWVFSVNAVTYGFIVVAILTVTITNAERDPSNPSGIKQMVAGFIVARHDRVVGRVLLTCAAFSFFCLIWIGQMATLAERNLGIAPKSVEYGVLYARFGFGALLGALSVGTVYAGRNLNTLVKIHLGGFTAMLAVLATVRSAELALWVILVLGYFYFVVITGLSTLLQKQLDETTRGRVMALWIMAFGGTVPIGNFVFGPIIELTSITAVLFVGVGVAAFLTWWADYRTPEEIAGDPAFPTTEPVAVSPPGKMPTSS